MELTHCQKLVGEGSLHPLNSDPDLIVLVDSFLGADFLVFTLATGVLAFWSSARAVLGTRVLVSSDGADKGASGTRGGASLGVELLASMPKVSLYVGYVSIETGSSCVYAGASEPRGALEKLDAALQALGENGIVELLKRFLCFKVFAWIGPLDSALIGVDCERISRLTLPPCRTTPARESTNGRGRC
jgi:hypothetical protein